MFPEDAPGCLDKVLDNGGRVICPMDKKYIKYQRYVVVDPCLCRFLFARERTFPLFQDFLARKNLSIALSTV